jgi:hypothetical protein
MHAPDESELLRVWDHGAGATAADRGLLLLQAAFPEVTRESLARWSIGWRDRRLLELRRVLFGDALAARTVCPRCGETVEFSLSAGVLLGSSSSLPPPETVSASVEGFELTARLPNSLDLLALEEHQPADSRADSLLRRCLLEVRRGDEPLASSDLPATALGALQLAMSAADPQSESYLDFTCAGCQYAWQALFDVTPFLWAELDAWARRVLEQVDALARSYGWSEAEILRLGSARRGRYLELAGT